jgi:serine/threonine protein kinase
MLIEGDRIGDFELLRVLGKGGFGAVWQARERRSGRTAAIKVLHSDLRKVRSDRGPSLADRFLTEARILKTLDHPGVVRVLEVFDHREDGVIAYAMEMLVGSDLAALRPEIDGAALIDVFAQVAGTLAHLHARGVLHRDVKPSNIFVCDAEDGGYERAVKLIDFGVAKDLDGGSIAESTATGMLVGTVQSMPPEAFLRLNGEEVELTGAVDQWGLGVALYRMISGRAPFRSEAILELISEIQRRPAQPLVPADQFVADDAAAQLEPVILRCIAKRPEARYADMSALAAELTRLSREVSAERTVGRPWGLARPEWPPPPPPRAPASLAGAELTDEAEVPDEGSRTQIAGPEHRQRLAETARRAPVRAHEGALDSAPQPPRAPSPPSTRASDRAGSAPGEDEEELQAEGAHDEFTQLAPRAEREPVRGGPRGAGGGKAALSRAAPGPSGDAGPAAAPRRVSSRSRGGAGTTPSSAPRSSRPAPSSEPSPVAPRPPRAPEPRKGESGFADTLLSGSAPDDLDQELAPPSPARGPERAAEGGSTALPASSGLVAPEWDQLSAFAPSPALRPRSIAPPPITTAPPPLSAPAVIAPRASLPPASQLAPRPAPRRQWGLWGALLFAVALVATSLGWLLTSR